MDLRVSKVAPMVEGNLVELVDMVKQMGRKGSDLTESQNRKMVGYMGNLDEMRTQIVIMVQRYEDDSRVLKRLLDLLDRIDDVKTLALNSEASKSQGSPSLESDKEIARRYDTPFNPLMVSTLNILDVSGLFADNIKEEDLEEDEDDEDEVGDEFWDHEIDHDSLAPADDSPKDVSSINLSMSNLNLPNLFDSTAHISAPATPFLPPSHILDEKVIGKSKLSQSMSVLEAKNNWTEETDAKGKGKEKEKGKGKQPATSNENGNGNRNGKGKGKGKAREIEKPNRKGKGKARQESYSESESEKSESESERSASDSEGETKVTNSRNRGGSWKAGVISAPAFERVRAATNGASSSSSSPSRLARDSESESYESESEESETNTNTESESETESRIPPPPPLPKGGKNKKHRKKKGPCEPILCKICYDEYTMYEHVWEFQECKHAYCNECLGDYLTTHINEGAVLDLVCPFPDCETEISPVDIKALCNSETIAKYERFTVLAALRADPNARWCPNVYCNNGIKYNASTMPWVYCNACKFEFCFHCMAERHDGVPCGEEALAYLKKKKESEESALSHFSEWTEAMSAYVKPCPTCKSFIEKNDGCNHMTCGNPTCRTQFCWLCLNLYTGDHFGDEANFPDCYDKQYWTPPDLAPRPNLVYPPLPRRTVTTRRFADVARKVGLFVGVGVAVVTLGVPAAVIGGPVYGCFQLHKRLKARRNERRRRHRNDGFVPPSPARIAEAAREARRLYDLEHS